MKKNVLFGLASLVVVVLIAFNVGLLAENRKFGDIITHLSEENGRLKVRNGKLYENIVQMTTVGLSDDVKLLNSMSDRVLASDLDAPALCLFFSESACSECNDEVIEALVTKASEYDIAERVFFLVPEKKVKSFYLKVQYRRSDVDVFGYSEDADGWQFVNQIDKPCVCVLNERGELENFIRVDKKSVFEMNEYVNRLIQRGVL